MATEPLLTHWHRRNDRPIMTEKAGTMAMELSKKHHFPGLGSVSVRLDPNNKNHPVKMTSVMGKQALAK